MQPVDASDANDMNYDKWQDFAFYNVPRVQWPPFSVTVAILAWFVALGDHTELQTQATG
jgi:hypothetical protein